MMNKIKTQIFVFVMCICLVSCTEMSPREKAIDYCFSNLFASKTGVELHLSDGLSRTQPDDKYIATKTFTNRGYALVVIGANESESDGYSILITSNGSWYKQLEYKKVDQLFFELADSKIEDSLVRTGGLHPAGCAFMRINEGSERESALTDVLSERQLADGKSTEPNAFEPYITVQHEVASYFPQLVDTKDDVLVISGIKPWNAELEESESTDQIIESSPSYQGNDELKKALSKDLFYELK